MRRLHSGNFTSYNNNNNNHVIKKIKKDFFTEPKMIFKPDEKDFLIQKIKESEAFNEEILKHISDDEIWESILKTFNSLTPTRQIAIWPMNN
jgi:hypothetical protein